MTKEDQAFIERGREVADMMALPGWKHVSGMLKQKINELDSVRNLPESGLSVERVYGARLAIQQLEEFEAGIYGMVDEGERVKSQISLNKDRSGPIFSEE